MNLEVLKIIDSSLGSKLYKTYEDTNIKFINAQEVDKSTLLALSPISNGLVNIPKTMLLKYTQFSKNEIDILCTILKLNIPIFISDVVNTSIHFVSSGRKIKLFGATVNRRNLVDDLKSIRFAVDTKEFSEIHEITLINETNLSMGAAIYLADDNICGEVISGKYSSIVMLNNQFYYKMKSNVFKKIEKYADFVNVFCLYL